MTHYIDTNTYQHRRHKTAQCECLILLLEKNYTEDHTEHGGIKPNTAISLTGLYFKGKAHKEYAPTLFLKYSLFLSLYTSLYGYSLAAVQFFANFSCALPILAQQMPNEKPPLTKFTNYAKKERRRYPLRLFFHILIMHLLSQEIRSKLCHNTCAAL